MNGEVVGSALVSLAFTPFLPRIPRKEIFSVTQVFTLFRLFFSSEGYALREPGGKCDPNISFEPVHCSNAGLYWDPRDLIGEMDSTSGTRRKQYSALFPTGRLRPHTKQKKHAVTVPVFYQVFPMMHEVRDTLDEPRISLL